MAIVDVIRHDGNPDIFAWKYPNNELGTWTQLIVNESQEAVFFKGGQALDLLGPGRHTLDTANIPILSKFINLPFGGHSPFSAEVWYVNKIHSLDIKWGTPTPIQLQDPKYNVFIPLRAFGQFGIQISDSKTFLTKLVGTSPMLSKDHILKYFRGVYLSKSKDAISSYLIKKGISVLEINAYLEELSQYLQERITPALDEYGIRLVNFYVFDINVPEDDPAVQKLKGALAKRAEMDIVGYNYTQERSFDTLEGAATNPGSGHASFMGAGLGLGMGVGIGGSMGSEMGSISKNMKTTPTKLCPECKTEMEKSQQFCPECGTDTKSSKKGTQSNKVVCSECGSSYANTVKFCPECGNPYTPCPNCGADLKEGDSICHKCNTPLPTPCPGCGFSGNTPDAKFCAECGFSLLKKCSSCNTPIIGNQKFCPECGEKL